MLGMRSFQLQILMVIAFTAGGQSSVARAATNLAQRVLTETPIEIIVSLRASVSLDSVYTLTAEAAQQAEAASETDASRKLLVLRGIIELQLEQSATSLVSLTQAMELCAAANDTTSWLEALGWASFAQAQLGRYDDALDTTHQMLDLAIAARERNKEAWGRIGLAYNGLATGKLEIAREEYQLAIKLFRLENNTRDEMTALIGLGRTYSQLGEVAQAQACYQKVYLVATDRGDLTNVAHALNNLGVLAYDFGDISESIGYYQRAFDLHQSTGSLNGSILAATNIAQSWMDLGRYSDSIRVLRTTLKLAAEGDRRVEAGIARVTLGWAYTEAKKYNRALSEFVLAASMEDTLTPKTQTEISLGQAKALFELERPDEAIEILRRRLGSESDQRRRATLGVTLAEHLRLAGYPSLAIEHAQQAVTQVAAFPDQNSSDVFYLELSAGQRAEGQLAAAAASFDQALLNTEELLARISNNDWRESAGAKRSWRLVEAAEIRLDFPSAASPAERQASFYDVVTAQKAKTLQERIGATSHPDNQIRDLTLTEIQNDRLGRGDLVLEFAVTWTHSWLFAVTANEMRLVRLPGNYGSFRKQVTHYVESLARVPAGQSPDLTDLGPLQTVLRDTLLGQITDMVAEADRIIVIPDGFLHALPLSTLMPPDQAAGIEFSRLPATAFLPSRTTPPDGAEPDRLLAIAGIDRAGGPLPGAEQEIDYLQHQFSGVRVATNLSDVQSVRDQMTGVQVLHIAAHVDVNAESPWHSGILLGIRNSVNPPATTEQLRSMSQAGRNALAIMTSADSVRVESLGTDAIYLRAGDIAAAELDARLAVLSGCESALGRVTLGEGVIGLGGAFLSAGVRTVVASLWPVDDKVTADLMEFFYSELATGVTVSGALHYAQRKIASQAGTSHPFYWAGFVVVGQGQDTVRLKPRSFAVSERVVVFSSLGLLLTGILVSTVHRQKKKNSNRV